VADSADLPALTAAKITGLWAVLQAHPIDSVSWRRLAEAYAAAGMVPHRAYATGQWQRLQPGAESTQVGPASHSLRQPAGPSPALADTWLQHPHSAEAQHWRQELETWLATCPGDWLSQLYATRLADGLPAQAATDSPIGALARAEALEPIPGESRHWLGVWRLEGGDARSAVAALSPLIDRCPPRHGSLLQLGLALLRLGNSAAAEAAFTRASASSNPAFLRLLAERVYQHNYWQEAIAVLRRAVELAPNDPSSLLALARLHWEVYELSEAEALCQRILQLDPAHGEVRYLLNALPGRRGDAAAHLAAVEAHYRERNDPSSRLASSIAMASLYVDALSPKQVAERHRRLCEPIEAATTAIAPTSTVPAFANSRDPDRPLRIGLVSGDFHRQHPVNLFMLPLLERLDPVLFPTTVFHTGSMHDDYTMRARQAAAAWIESGQLNDQALKQRIVDERIDVLIDLAGHTSTHRLGVFALRSAPVQATFLGYPHSTGLSRIDWLIGDPVVSPAEHAHLFSEGIAQLPGSVFCWSPVDDYPLPPRRPPDAPLVFGSFNNVMKLSPRTLRLWAAVLRDLPDAQLLLKAPSLGDASVVERFRGLFAAEGIAPERLLLEGPEGLERMMQRYGAIDIALDPTPYNGGTTTLQALWMGVPVISLAGGNFVSRMGASFLTALGKPEWIATDDGHFRAIARELAAQLPALRRGRSELRQQMAASGLSDLDRYAEHFQGLLRRIWQHHCRGEPGRLLAAENGTSLSAEP